MTITMSILYEKLSADYRCRRNKKVFFDNPVRSLLLYSHCPLPSEYVYVAEGSELRAEDLAGASVICAGEPPFDYGAIPCDLIMVDSVANGKALFNRVQTIFLALLQWDVRLESAAHDSMDLGLLLEEGRREMNFSFVFLNMVFKPIATSADLRTGERGEMNEEILSQVLQCRSVEDVSRFNGAREFDDPATGKRGLYFNVYYRDDYRGKLLALCDRHRAITQADRSLFETLCGHAGGMYRLFSTSSMRSSGYRLIQHALRTVLEGGDIFDKSDILGALQTTGWGVNDEYVVFYIPFGEKGSLSIKAEYIVTLMENRWNSLGQGSTRGTVLEYGVVWVVNRSRPAEVDYAPLIPEIEAMLRRYGAQMGVSAVCRDFFALPAYLKQAGIAIHLGQQKEGENVMFRFGKYSLDYMLDSSLGIFTAEDVIHPSLPLLIAYDRENNTEFCKTLRMFIRCKYNVLQASSELFIHRSTFSVRIKRIESLCHIDLDDERTRLHILMSFYILERMGQASYL